MIIFLLIDYWGNLTLGYNHFIHSHRACGSWPVWIILRYFYVYQWDLWLVLVCWCVLRCISLIDDGVWFIWEHSHFGWFILEAYPSLGGWLDLFSMVEDLMSNMGIPRLFYVIRISYWGMTTLMFSLGLRNIATL